MKRAVKVLLVIGAVVVIGGVAMFIIGSGEAAPTEEPHVTVRRGSLVVLPMVRTGFVLNRVEGGLLLAGYAAYVYWLYSVG